MVNSFYLLSGPGGGPLVGYGLGFSQPPILFAVLRIKLSRSGAEISKTSYPTGMLQCGVLHQTFLLIYKCGGTMPHSK